MFTHSWINKMFGLTSQSMAHTQRRLQTIRLALESLEDRTAPAVFNLLVNPGVDNANAVNELIADMTIANQNGQANTINLFAGGTYKLSTPNNFFYGPDGLPAVSSNLTINGQDATVLRDPTLPQTTAGAFRFLYVSGGFELPRGSLTLNNLTLQNGLAKGGDSQGGGGGLGAGGAIFNQGMLTLCGDAANALFEQSNAFGPVGLNTGFRLLSPAGTIQSISAVTDKAGNDVVYAIATSGNNLWEHSPAFSGNGWQKLSTGAFAQVSSGLNAAGQAVAYSVLTNHQLWEQNPMFGPPGVDMQLRQLSGMNGLPPSFLSVTAGNPDVAFGVAADHTIWEHSPAENIQLSSMLLANQLSATQMQPSLQEVFMTLTDGSFWEFSTAFPKNNPFKELFTSGAASSTTPG